MKLITKLTAGAMMAAASLTANAQALGDAILVAPTTDFPTFLQTITVAYDFQIIKIADYDMMVDVTFGGETYQVYADVYADSDIAWELDQEFDDPEYGNTLIVDFSTEAYQAGYPVGPYVIELPEGLVVNQEGETNPAQVFTVYKYDMEKPKVAPADGMYKPADLTNVTLTFKNEIQVIPGGGQIEVRELNDWLSSPIVVKNYAISDDGLTLSMDLSNILPRGMRCMINVPEGFLKVGEYGINAETWLYYTNWDGMDQGTIISAPPATASLDTMKPVVITWNRQPIKFTSNPPDTEFLIGYPDFGYQEGDRVWIPYDYFSLVYVNESNQIEMDPAEGTANAIYIDLEDLIDMSYLGEPIELNIPVGLVENYEGLDNPAITVSFFIRELWPAPSITVTGKDEINVMWPDISWITYFGSSDVKLYGPDNKTYTLEYTYGGALPGQVTLDFMGTHAMIVDLSNLDLANGRYTLYIPQGYVLIDDIDGTNQIINGPVTYEFDYTNGDIVSGVSSIMADGLKGVVFDLHGRKVGTQDDLSGLAKGIYILNGKKILVK